MRVTVLQQLKCLVLAQVFVTTTAKLTPDFAPGLGQNLPCTLYLRLTEFQDGGEGQEWMCEVAGIDAWNAGSNAQSTFVGIEGAGELLPFRSSIVSGKTTMLAKGAKFYKSSATGQAKLVLNTSTPLTFGEVEDRRQRRLSPSTGDLDVLVVRVSGLDSSVTKDAATLSSDVFGGNGDAINLKSNVEACSNGMARILDGKTEAGTNYNIVNGVHEIQLNYNVVGVRNDDIRQQLETDLSGLYGMPLSQKFTNVMMCMPPGTYDRLPDGSEYYEWAAYSFMNYYVSVFNDEFCSFEGVQLHEFGHDWGLGHSRQPAEFDPAQDDETGAMGPARRENPDDTVLKNKLCFNGPHSYLLPWYSAYNVDILNPLQENYYGTLIGSARISSIQAGQNVVIKIKNSAKDYYIMYNQAIGQNAGTYEAKDQVTITSRPDVAPGVFAETLLEYRLSGGDHVTFTKWEGTRDAVTVLVSNIDTSSDNGHAIVEIFKGRMKDRPPAPAPPPAPTVAPAPTDAPLPTDTPVPAPTDAPGPTPVCGGNKASCSIPSDCCSSSCNRGTCKGNGRFLRAP